MYKLNICAILTLSTLGEMRMAVFKITEESHIDINAGATPQFVKSLKYSSPEHNHDYYEVFMIVNGSCVHKVNGSEQHLSEGSLVFIRPDDRHFYADEGNSGCEFINIAYASSVIKGAFSFLGDEICKDKLLSDALPPCVILSALEKDSLMDRYYRVTAVMSVNKASARILLQGLLIELLTQYFLGAWNNASTDAPLWFTALLKQMQKKDNFKTGLAKMYELSGRSRGHLNRTFRQILNLTPTDYINHIRLNYAKNLLLTTNLSIIDISLGSGFQNLSHFNHLFKENFGMAPSRLRQYKN